MQNLGDFFWEQQMDREGAASEYKPVPIVDARRCSGCGLCARACEGGALGMSEGKALISRPEACTYGGLCERICPEGAISLPFEVVFGDVGEQDSAGEVVCSKREEP